MTLAVFRLGRILESLLPSVWSHEFFPAWWTATVSNCRSIALRREVVLFKRLVKCVNTYCNAHSFITSSFSQSEQSENRILCLASRRLLDGIVVWTMSRPSYQATTTAIVLSGVVLFPINIHSTSYRALDEATDHAEWACFLHCLECQLLPHQERTRVSGFLVHMAKTPQDNSSWSSTKNQHVLSG